MRNGQEGANEKQERVLPLRESSRVRTQEGGEGAIQRSTVVRG